MSIASVGTEGTSETGHRQTLDAAEVVIPPSAMRQFLLTFAPPAALRPGVYSKTLTLLTARIDAPHLIAELHVLPPTPRYMLLLTAPFESTSTPWGHARAGAALMLLGGCLLAGRWRGWGRRQRAGAPLAAGPGAPAPTYGTMRLWRRRG